MPDYDQKTEQATRVKFNPRIYEDTKSRHCWTVTVVRGDSEAEKSYRLKLLMRKYPHYSLEKLLHLLSQ